MMKNLRAWISRLEANPRTAGLVQFVKFGIVGVSNTLISLAIYWMCYYVLGWHYQISNIVAFVISVTNAYYWNSRYVFQNRQDNRFSQQAKRYLKSMVSYGSTFLLSTALLTFWVEVLAISAGIAPLINLLITIPLNYLLNKHWAFRKGKDVPVKAENPPNKEV